MMTKYGLLTFLAASHAAAETVFGAVVFSRHGDRTAKYYPGYQVTNLGAQQLYQSGEFYRQRYIEQGALSQIAGIAPDRADHRQLWASAPDQAVLFQTAQNFLQGLYPPLAQLDQQLAEETLTNGTSVSDPLSGYQYVHIHGEGDADPDTIWLKGSDACPAYAQAVKSYSSSPEYKRTLNETGTFYSEFDNLLNPILGPGNVTYKNAYDVFDLLNVASIHNTSVAPEIDAADLAQLRYLANLWEWNRNFNASQPDRSIGGMTLAGAFLQRLQALTETGARRNKFQLMTGSYNVFLQFFGFANLTAASTDFFGLPNYAASMVLEGFSNEGSAANPAAFPSNDTVDTELQVRFLFKNGTGAGDQLTAYPLFGGADTAIPYGRFVDVLNQEAIVSLEQWCSRCGATEAFCVATNATNAVNGSSISNGPNSGSQLSNAAAGGIGAGVTLVVVAIIGALAWLLMRKKSKSSAVGTASGNEKRLSDSGNESV